MHWSRFPPVHVTAAVFAGVEEGKGKGPISEDQPRPAKKMLTNADIVTMHSVDTRKLMWQRVPNG